MRTWEVELIIYGAITIQRNISFNTDKELNLGNIFRSDINIKPYIDGIKISSTVRTNNQDSALKIALLFIGKMLDILSLKTNIPLNISRNNEYRKGLNNNRVKAVIKENELKDSFELSRDVNLAEPTLLRAIGWYRKGLYTEDPFDKFLAFWNSISVVANKYHNDNPRTRQGTINQIWDCFSTVWGNNIINWEYIDGDERWINNNHEIRNNIAHGVIPVEINNVENVIERLDLTQKVAYKFLLDWTERMFHRNIL